MITLPRRWAPVGAALAALIGLATTAAPAQAAMDVAHRPSEEFRLAQLLERRATALQQISIKADARDRTLAGRAAVLAQYGYVGSPDLVEVVLPLASYSLSAGFGLTGPLWEATHGGQDFGASTGDTLVAVATGTITEVGDAGPYGLRTILTLEDGTEIWYCHQTAVNVAVDQVVEVADPIGQVGSTGNSVGPHLHMEVRPDAGDPVDPMEWLRSWGLTP